MNTFINTFKHIRIYNVFSDESGLFRYFKVSFGSGILTLNLRNIIKNISLINFYSNQCWILSVHTHLIVFKTIQKKTLDHLCDFIKIELTNAALLFSFHEHNRYDPSDHFTAGKFAAFLTRFFYSISYVNITIPVGSECFAAKVTIHWLLPVTFLVH